MSLNKPIYSFVKKEIIDVYIYTKYIEFLY